MYHLILLRHGESEWNKANKFGGWADLKLSEAGKKEASKAGLLLKKYEHPPQKVFTSKLSRAIQSSHLALESADLLWIDCVHTYRLNERHYGALQGRNKADIEKMYGHEKYMEFRRSLSVAPPPIDPEDEWSQVNDPRYAKLHSIPLTESLQTMTERIRSFWCDEIAKDLRFLKSVLVVGHGNSLRGLIRIVRNVSNEEIRNIDLKTGVPFVIELDQDLKPVDSVNWCRYLE